MSDQMGGLQRLRRPLKMLSGLMVISALSACSSFLSGTGPRTGAVLDADSAGLLAEEITVIDTDSAVWQIC